MLNKNKLKVAAAATGICALGAFGAYEADSAHTDSISKQKTECYAEAPNHADECVKTIDDNNQSEYLSIEILEAGLLFGAAVSGMEFIKTLRKV